VGLERTQLGEERCWTRPGTPTSRHDVGFEQCDHGNDVVTVGRLVSRLVIDELSGPDSIVRTVTSLYAALLSSAVALADVFIVDCLAVVLISEPRAWASFTEGLARVSLRGWPLGQI
jgi:hypothetical protein